MSLSSDSERGQKEAVAPQKEVVPGGGPEIAPRQTAFPEAYAYHGHNQGVVDPPALPFSSSSTPRLWFRRKRFWLSGLVVIFVIAIVVLGTLLGISLKGQNDNDEHSDLNQTGTSGISALSSLTAASWELDSGDYVIKLVYEVNAGQLQATTYESRRDKWTATNFTTVKKGSPLAITRFNQANMGMGNETQIELFHLDGDNRPSEWVWNVTIQTGNGQRGSMNQFNEKASNTSKLSAYWPFVIFQNETQYLKGYGYGNGWTEWDIGPTELTIYDGSSLSIMRTGTNKSELSIFYQNVDGDLMEYQITQNEVKNVVNTTATNQPSFPRGFSMAAYSTGPSASSEVSTYVLYQDSSSTIQMLRRSSSSDPWSVPKTFDAFNGADNGTSLACIALNNVYDSSQSEQKPGPRCYFQAGGLVREVQMEGEPEEWKVLGNITMT